MQGRWLQGWDMKMHRSLGVGTPGGKKSAGKWRRVKMRRKKERVRTLWENYGDVKSKRESEPEPQGVNGCVTQRGSTQSGSSILSATIAADWVGQGFAGLNTSQPHKAIEQLARVIWPLNASSLLQRWARSGYSVRLPSRWTSGTSLYRDASRLRSRTGRKRNALSNLQSYIFIPTFFSPPPSHLEISCLVVASLNITARQENNGRRLIYCSPVFVLSRADLSSAALSLTHAFFQLSDSQRTS